MMKQMFIEESNAKNLLTRTEREVPDYSGFKLVYVEFKNTKELSKNLKNI